MSTAKCPKGPCPNLKLKQHFLCVMSNAYDAAFFYEKVNISELLGYEMFCNFTKERLHLWYISSVMCFAYRFYS